jgi:hypothetical protein
MPAKKNRKDPDKTEIEGLEVKIHRRVVSEDGIIRSREVQTYIIDTKQAFLNIHQQTGRNGDRMEKVGKPHLVLHGLVEDDSGSEEKKEAEEFNALDISAKRRADIVNFIVFHKGSELYSYKMSDREMNSSMFQHHIAIMVDSIVRRTGIPTRDVQKSLLAVVSEQTGVLLKDYLQHFQEE